MYISSITIYVSCSLLALFGIDAIRTSISVASELSQFFYSDRTLLLLSTRNVKVSNIPGALKNLYWPFHESDCFNFI
ncbi:hypothetical protein F8M41_021760 [Gigaspora margarita]|uniref:Uncharacterized protein n=1 Tax=Gigaspora margarita TaxID=4874 RepID=A0A8H4EIJ4_GIGMA|nr:hypothetical protein F8M41_021760 [Gigaspora margarita]